MNQSDNGGALYIENWGNGGYIQMYNMDFSLNEGGNNRDLRISGVGSSDVFSNINLFDGGAGSVMQDFSTTTNDEALYIDADAFPPNLRLSPDSALYRSQAASTGDRMDPDNTEADIGAYAGSNADKWDIDGDGYYQCWNMNECDDTIHDSDDFNPDLH